MRRYAIQAVVALVAIGLLLRFSPLVSVPAGHRGVVTLFGKVQAQALDEGLHAADPFARVTAPSIRLQKTDSQGDAARRDRERSQVEAQQKVALAEAASLRAQKQEITPDLIHLREIEVQRQAIEKWDGHLPHVNGGAVPFLNPGHASAGPGR